MNQAKGGTLLIVDDEIQILRLLEFVLKDEGYTVLTAETGEDALEQCRRQAPDLVVLDLTLPGMDGFEVCRQLCDADIPVLILSSHDEDRYVIAGLETGALDYVRKPFNHKELILRVANLLGRGRKSEPKRYLNSDSLRLDLDTEQVTVDGRPVHLTPTEYQLLALLMRRGGAVVGVDEILQSVWGAQEWDGARQLIKVNIQRLRQKIEADPRTPRFVLNQWGRGYRFGSSVTVS